MTDIAEILKDTPKGTLLYSPIFGEVELDVVVLDTIYVKYHCNKNSNDFSEFTVSFNKEGKYNPYYGECMLFPSKDQRDWNKFQVPCQFKPFDKVVVRNHAEGFWHIDFFETIFNSDEQYPFRCCRASWEECLPYNEETAKLIGTTDDYAD